MTEIHYTLVSDGSSDKCLIPIINWLVRQCGFQGWLEGTCVDYRLLKEYPTKNHLANKIIYALQLYPCDLLFVHRDTERASVSHRRDEIMTALDIVFQNNPQIPTVSVIPIRMSEAWLLCNEEAIRYASGNSNANIPIILPRILSLENLPDPKDILYNLLRTACGLSGRRLNNFHPQQCVHRISDYIQDFSILRSLSAFRSLENDICNILPKVVSTTI